MSEPKLRARNFPMWLLKPLFKVASFGEKKHGSLSFLTAPITVNDHLDALKRHLIALEDPSVPDLDDESLELHSSHIAWRALAITYLLANKKELDDRYKPEVKDLPKSSPRFPIRPDGTCDYIYDGEFQSVPRTVINDMDLTKVQDGYIDPDEPKLKMCKCEKK
jgi:hypothetical protein